MSPMRTMILATAVLGLAPACALAQAKLKVGLMLPYTGTYAAVSIPRQSRGH